MQILKCAVLACVIAFALSLAPSTTVVRAQDSRGTCNSSSHADARAYDGSATGSADGGVSAGNYWEEDCIGLAQTGAVFAAGNACVNAGIPAGVASGLGYAVVTWDVTWVSHALDQPDNPQPTVAEHHQQQYDCGDTYSY